jgi:hypothetical protein
MCLRIINLYEVEPQAPAWSRQNICHKGTKVNKGKPEIEGFGILGVLPGNGFNWLGMKITFPS